MKVSEITAANIKDYARIDGTDDDWLVDAILSAAMAHVVSQTGLPLLPDVDADGVPVACVDDYEDLTIAVLVLASDMYDNRSCVVDKSGVNKAVESILGAHCHNLL